MKYNCNICRLLPGEYEHSSSKSRDPSDRPQKQNGNFLKKGSEDFDKFLTIYGDITLNKTAKVVSSGQ
jgi:hypothetical protein